MNRIAKFSKVSYEQFKKDFMKLFDIDEKDGSVYDKEIKMSYDSIMLPKRATSGSAGYDFFSPFGFDLYPGESIVIPTGIRCEMNSNWVLMEFPRSGLGFKYGLSMANTIPVIDSDYFHSDNEGHILVKLVNDSCIAHDLGHNDGAVEFDVGKAFCQGIFLQYGVTIDDDVETVRNGGFGSTDN